MRTPEEYLRIDVDYESTGIWILKEPFQRTAGVNAPYEDFNLPQWLLDRFNFWTHWFNQYEPWNNEKNEPDDELFEAYGLSLAIDLKRFLGVDYHIEFRGKEIVNPDQPMSRDFARQHHRKLNE